MIKSFKGFVMALLEGLVEARKARAESITRGIGR